MSCELLLESVEHVALRWELPQSIFRIPLVSGFNSSYVFFCLSDACMLVY